MGKHTSGRCGASGGLEAVTLREQVARRILFAFVAAGVEEVWVSGIMDAVLPRLHVRERVALADHRAKPGTPHVHPPVVEAERRRGAPRHRFPSVHAHVEQAGELIEAAFRQRQGSARVDPPGVGPRRPEAQGEEDRREIRQLQMRVSVAVA